MLTKYNPAKVGILDELRQDGYKVFVSHKRVIADSVWEGERIKDFLTEDAGIFITRHEIKTHGYTWGDISLTGGVTTVTIYDSNQQKLGEGVAVCCQNDSFNKHLGLTIALGRALKNASISD